MSLKEALQNPLFEQYKLNQPFNKNYLQPCPLLDNPDTLKAMVHRSGAKSTQPIDEESVDELTDKLQETSKEWAPVAEKIYATSGDLSEIRHQLPPRYWDEEWYLSEENPDNTAIGQGNRKLGDEYRFSAKMKDIIYTFLKIQQ